MAIITTSSAVQPLENGDRLTRHEFHRIYGCHPELKHVQLVEGIVYLGSPVRFSHHMEPQGLILTWLGVYCATHPQARFGGPGTVILDDANEPEPDAVLMLTPEAGGATRLEDDYIVGAPELVVEVSGTTASIDLGDKLRAYQRNGVREYIVWTTFDEQLRWLSLEDGQVVLLPDDAGVIHSRVFPGLRLAVDRLLARDVQGVLAALQDAPA